MITYAQNLEDVVLNRIFENRPKGFYIDVGAHDPIELSVTKHFYDLGWTGINIEPVQESYERFLRMRPKDVNINCAMGSKHEILPLYRIKGHPELSSMNSKIANSAGKLLDAEIDCIPTETKTLEEICDRFCYGAIDFIKIDVEGSEKQVILGGNWKRYRPVIIVVESTTPNSGRVVNWDTFDDRLAYREWESFILSADYIFVYFDGLNRYYLRNEDRDLKNRFSFPVTFFQDDFFHYKHQRLVIDSREQVKILKEKNQTLEMRIKQLSSDNDELKKEIEKLKP